MPVETQVAKWGNSLAVRIPRTLVKEAHLAEGDRLSLDLDPNGDLILRAVRRRYGLNQLVAGITPRNRHDETEWGASTGKES